MTSLPVPKPTPDTAPFWDAAKRHELQLQQCNSCGQFYFYPRSFCRYCASPDVTWRPLTGRASLHSYVVNHRPVPPFPVEEPQVIALVQLEEGPRMLSNVIDVDPSELTLDMPLEVRFQTRGNLELPMFTPRTPETIR